MPHLLLKPSMFTTVKMTTFAQSVAQVFARVAAPRAQATLIYSLLQCLSKRIGACPIQLLKFINGGTLARNNAWEDARCVEYVAQRFHRTLKFVVGNVTLDMQIFHPKQVVAAASNVHLESIARPAFPAHCVTGHDSCFPCIRPSARHYEHSVAGCRAPTAHAPPYARCRDMDRALLHDHGRNVIQAFHWQQHE